MSELAPGAKGLVVVVTGASGNLGRAVCRRILGGGGSAFALVRRAEELLALAQDLAGGDRFAGAVAELGSEEAVEVAFTACELSLGAPWALVNAAGAWGGGGTIADAPVAQFDKMIDANLRSAWICSRAAMRRFLKGEGGRIVNVAALSAQRGVGVAGQTAYAAAKAGVIGLTLALAEEGAVHGVRTTCIAPGTLRTPENERAMLGADPSRWVPLEQVAETIAFLCSTGAGAVNGGVIAMP